MSEKSDEKPKHAFKCSCAASPVGYACASAYEWIKLTQKKGKANLSPGLKDNEASDLTAEKD
jgi:hypothetical protein